MGLSNTQRELLALVVELSERGETAVSAGRIAEEVGQSPNTVRNKMLSLRAQSLVESTPGPKGGYRPTSDGYAALGDETLGRPESIRLTGEYAAADVTVERIELTTVQDPARCEATIHYRGDLGDLASGDPVLFGPTPVAAVVLAGTVQAIDPDVRKLDVDVSKINAPVGSDG